MPAGSNAPGVRSAVTSRYSRITSAAATHSCRPRSRPIRARSSGSSPRSSARISSSRSSARKPLSRNAGRTCSGQSGTAPSPGQVALDQLAQHGVLLGAGDQPRARLAGQHGRAADQPEGVRGRGAGERLADRERPDLRQPRGDPLAQRRRGEPGRREHQHVRGVEPVARDPRHDGLDQGRGLAGAGRAHQHQRTAARPPGHHLGLHGVELRRLHRTGRTTHEAQRRGRRTARHRSHHSAPTARPRCPPRPTGRAPGRPAARPAAAGCARRGTGAAPRPRAPAAAGRRRAAPATTGTSEPYAAITEPTPRGPPRPTSSATSP